MTIFSSLRLALAFLLAASLPAAAQDAAALRVRHTELREALTTNAFARPLMLESREDAGQLRGDIYARIAQPFAVAGPALQGVAHWCEILTLHLNVKRCRATQTPAGNSLGLVIGRKFDQPVADAYSLDFNYTQLAKQPDYLQLMLSADQGPLGTNDYRIVLEVVALDAKHSFLHLSYAYGYGLVARVAMQGYLATVGRDKVGFSRVGIRADGEPIYIGGTRGVIERNTMRYYLAIEAYLGALGLPQPLQLDKRLDDWYSSVERYPRQLHELDRAEYLALKRSEALRQ